MEVRLRVGVENCEGLRGVLEENGERKSRRIGALSVAPEDG